MIWFDLDDGGIIAFDGLELRLEIHATRMGLAAFWVRDGSNAFWLVEPSSNWPAAWIRPLLSRRRNDGSERGRVLANRVLGYPRAGSET
jgi:hypothetical protein